MSVATPEGTPIHALNFVSLDLETTGIAPAYDDIIEIGAARFRLRADGVTEAGPCFDQLVRPSVTISEQICVLTGIDNAMVADAPPLREVWPELLAFLSAEPNTVIIAHNVRADLGFLVVAGESLGHPWPDHSAYCTFRVAREVLADAPNYRLATLVQWLELGSEASVFHRALADAIHTRNLLAACVKQAGVTFLEELRGGRRMPKPQPIEFEVIVPPALAGVEASIRTRAKVHLAYRGGSKGTELRPVTPLSFYREEDVLYLRAHCHLDDSIKSFRCDRIRRVELGEPTG
jgi:DNA polymerase III epsilon subunit-like protein